MVSASFWEQSFLVLSKLRRKALLRAPPQQGLEDQTTQGQGSTRSVLVHPSAQCLGFLSFQIPKLTHSAQN